jgi:tRNA 2-thiouridine synthesizing protein A
MERQEGPGQTNSSASRRMGGDARLHPNAEWDAGDMGCGELVLELRMRLQPMQPGQLLKLTARDLGALEDLPAWCRLTGHRLVMAVHPVYWIGRRED